MKCFYAISQIGILVAHTLESYKIYKILPLIPEHIHTYIWLSMNHHDGR